MKRLKALGIIGSLLLFACVAFAQQWHIANQATFAWDAVANPDPNTPPISRIVYDTFMKDNKGGDPIPLGTTDQLEYVVTFTTEGKWFLGVETVREILAADGVTVEDRIPSGISWSDDPTVCENGVDFGIKYFLHPNKGGRLRIINP